MTFDVVVVHFGDAELTRRCIASLQCQNSPVHDIIVVDNDVKAASRFSSDTALTNVRVITNTANKGYAAALNQGIKETQGDVIILANNDLAFDPRWTQQIAAGFDERPSCGIIASKVLYMDTPEIINSAGCLVYPDLVGVNRGLDEVDKGQYDEPGEAFCAYGAVIAVRREVVRKIGHLEEDYFLFMEEDEFAWRARLSGYSTWYVPSAVVYHKRSANTVLFSPLKLFYSERNRIWNIIKFFPWWYLIVAGFYSYRRYLVNARMMSGKSTVQTKKSRALGKRSKLPIVWALIRAHIAALWGIPAILPKRRRINRGACMSHRERIAFLRRFAARVEDLVK